MGGGPSGSPSGIEATFEQQQRRYEASSRKVAEVVLQIVVAEDMDSAEKLRALREAHALLGDLIARMARLNAFRESASRSALKGDDEQARHARILALEEVVNEAASRYATARSGSPEREDARLSVLSALEELDEQLPAAH